MKAVAIACLTWALVQLAPLFWGHPLTDLLDYAQVDFEHEVTFLSVLEWTLAACKTSCFSFPLASFTVGSTHWSLCTHKGSQPSCLHTHRRQQVLHDRGYDESHELQMLCIVCHVSRWPQLFFRMTAVLLLRGTWGATVGTCQAPRLRRAVQTR